MENVNVTIRIDKELKNQCEELFKDLGLNLSSAINVFLRQSLRDQAIPFQIRRNDCYIHPTKKTLERVSKELIEENLEAYKELAKK